VSFAAITLRVASQRVFIAAAVVVVVDFVMTQSGNFWTHPRMYINEHLKKAGVITSSQNFLYPLKTLSILHEVVTDQPTN
jgi:hypothetical protein